MLEVCYDYVYEFWDALIKEEQYDTVICLGLSAKATRLKLELFARNKVGETPDVKGKNWSTDFIVAEGPPCLGSTIMPPDLIFAASEMLDARTLELSTNPGDYLCNFLYYLMLAGHPGQVGFIHVERHEHAQHCCLQDQKADEVKLYPFVNVKAEPHGDRGEECG